MAINRAPWAALVDDDGSNLVGSVWNKAAIQTVLLDPMDAAITPLQLGLQFSIPQFSAGQIDNLDPGGAGAALTVWYLNSTVPTYLTGIKAPLADGTVHWLVNTGSTTITLAHLFGSTAANQFIGAGYANTDLPPWRAVPVVYALGFTKWIVLKP